MKSIHRITLLLLGMALAFSAVAAIPAGYYDSCEGKTGQALLKALYDKISDHTNVGYDGLWEVYRKSDVHPDGSLWDIYSTKHWGSNFSRCGNYTAVGDCVNREHSLPKSWWGGGKSAQYSDAFHLYPTDGRVNGQRSNYPFGECRNGTSLAANGNVKPLGRLGASTFDGFSGTVFEPDDQYKGDLARSYFYMAACYNGIIGGWTSGNGGQFFAGNSYPVFKTWSRDLLLKWARQDQVSQKEIDRNDAIYSYQHNRNPFIDYPELAEYVWGDKVGQPWHPGGSTDPVFELPVQNTVIDLGHAACGIARSTTVGVKGRNLTSAVTLTATGNFTVSPSTLTAAAANAGAQVTVTVTAASAGDAEGMLTMTSGEATRAVDLYANVVDGLPADISDVTTSGFTLRWVDVHASQPLTTYSVVVKQGNANVAGFPHTVKASDEQLTVTGLDPSTTYTVTFADVPGGIKVPQLTVTTAEPVPSIQVLYDGELHFDARPGEASDVAELLLEIENIDSEIAVDVTAPFEVSTDKTSWAASTTLAPDEERFYLRVAPTVAGSYETAITLTAGTYSTDDASATATVADKAAFIEDWEGVDDPTNTVKTYSSTTFQATACRWNVDNGGFGTGSQDKAFNGTVAMRLGSDATSSIAMDEDKTGGLGTVTFDAAKWPNTSEPTAVVDLEYSTDGGITWSKAATFEIGETASQSFKADINVAGNGRIRLAQTSGKRWFVDNIAIGDHSATGAVAELDYHHWDAYCLDGTLVIECRDASRHIRVYGIDGISRFDDNVGTAGRRIELPAGLYIVTDDNFARRVIVK